MDPQLSLSIKSFPQSPCLMQPLSPLPGLWTPALTPKMSASQTLLLPHPQTSGPSKTLFGGLASLRAHQSWEDQQERWPGEQGHSHWQGLCEQQSGPQDRRGRPVTPERVGTPCLPPSQRDHLPSLECWLPHIRGLPPPHCQVRLCCRRPCPWGRTEGFFIAHQALPICFQRGTLSHGVPQRSPNSPVSFSLRDKATAIPGSPQLPLL